MNIIDLDQALIVDPRPFLKKFYKKGKPAKDIAWDDYAAWNVLIERAKQDGCFFYTNYCFYHHRLSENFKSLSTVDLLDEHNNVVVTVNPKHNVWFKKGEQDYIAFGPFVVKHFRIPLLTIPETVVSEEEEPVVESENESLEYLDEVGVV